MTFVFARTPDNPRLRAAVGSNLPATLGESVEAAFDDPLLQPTELIEQQVDITEASGRTQSAFDILAVNRARRGDISIREAERIARTGEEPLGPELIPEPEGEISGVNLDQITAAEANKEFGDLGLKFDRPIARRAAELIARGKREEIVRQDIIRRGPQGVLPTAARLGAGLTAAAIDPLNVASAFIPIVSQARFAGLVSRFGVTRARLTAGSIEGAVGNALIEPVVGGLAVGQQLDYEMSDAIVNIAFGGILGGGLHVGAGRMSDFLSARTAEAREGALRAAVAQTARGDRVDIDAIFRPDRAFDDGTRIEPPPAREFDIGPPTGQGRGQRFADYTPIGPRDREFIEGLVAELDQTDSGQRFFREADRQGSTPDVTGVRASTPEWFQNHNRGVVEEQRRLKKLREVNKRLPTDQRVPVPSTPSILTREKVRAVADKMMGQKPLGEAEAEVARLLFAVSRDQRIENARQIAEFRAQRSLEQEREIDAIAAREAEDIAAGQARPERDATADFEASARVDEDLTEQPVGQDAQTVQTEVDFLTDQFEAYRNLGLISDREFEEIQILNELAENAESYGRATKAAAICLSRQS